MLGRRNIRDFLLQIGKCRYIMCGTFETGRKGLDASLEAGLEAHRDLITSKYPNGGIGSDPFITIGKKNSSMTLARIFM